MCDDVFGKGWGSFKIAHLSTGDKIGVEIFEFKNAEQRENNFEYWKTGVFHFCVQDPDVEGLAAKIVERGYALHSPAYNMLWFELMDRGVVNLAASLPTLPSGYIASKYRVSDYRLLNQSIKKFAT